MTKQIKDLARKHLIVENERVNNGIRTIEVREEDLEEFIHLIIQECAEICRKGINNATDWDSSYWDQACENRAETIRQHFGVTE